ncbi:glycosyltransferase [Halomonas sp. V046]|uniref:glycosyltransferase n=1 Tax=Halomonas sp. V046 TaxID=3459611 RepID=UPI004044A627
MKDQRRFLLVLRRMGIGGIEQATQTLADALATAGHDVHLLVLKGEVNREFHPGVTLHRHDVDKVSRKGLGLLLHLADRLCLSRLIQGSGFVWRGKRCSVAFSAFVQALEEGQTPFDMILIRGQGAFENLWDYNDHRTWRVVEAVTGRFPCTAKGRWLARVLYQGKKVICVSKGVKSALNDYLRRQGVNLVDSQVIYNAIPIARIQQLANRGQPMEIAPPYFVHVARLVPVKNQRRLLSAYHLAVNKGLQQDLVIIGEGSERPALEDMARHLGLAAKVHFLGQQANPYPWVKDADALVLSSDFEGLGIVLLEALVLGTPCIACDVPGGISEVLTGDQRRMLCAPNEEALADKLLEAATSVPDVKDEWTTPFSEASILLRLMSLADESSTERPHAQTA